MLPLHEGPEKRPGMSISAFFDAEPGSLQMPEDSNLHQPVLETGVLPLHQTSERRANHALRVPVSQTCRDRLEAIAGFLEALPIAGEGFEPSTSGL